MIRFDDALPDLGIFAGADALSQALGRRVRIERIRYKPGTSIVAAVRDESGRPSMGAHPRGSGESDES